MKQGLLVAVLLLLSQSVGCKMQDDDGQARGAQPSVIQTAQAAKPAADRPAGKLEFVSGPAGEIPAAVVAQRARDPKRVVLVYAGATWCEPCQRFHAAAKRGELDGELPNLTLLEYDVDVDRDRLFVAGYDSKYIPLFALPGPDGRASGRFEQGSVKGDGAVREITPRLRRLIGG
jgi:thiol-disulfide isomerase/thioredoxin